MNPSINLSKGFIGDHETHDAILVSFEIVDTNIGGVLRCTKEYSLAYVPDQDKWYGDVIAYGKWLDLTEGELLQLHNAYNLDELVSIELDRHDKHKSNTRKQAYTTSSLIEMSDLSKKDTLQY